MRFEWKFWYRLRIIGKEKVLIKKWGRGTMGVVFFVGFLLVLFFIGLFLLTGFLAFFLVGLLGGHKHKKMRFFYIPAGILFLLGGFCTASPFIFLGFVKKLNGETMPLVGHYIDQDTYQDQSFSVDGVTYDLMPYRPIFGVEKTISNLFAPIVPGFSLCI